MSGIRPTYATDHGTKHFEDQPSGRLGGESWEDYEKRVLAMTHFSADTAKRSDIQSLEPDVRVKVIQLLDAAQRAGQRVEIVETRRTQERQEMLFQEGRVPGRGKKEVTWTLTSAHTPGRAVDVRVNDDPTGRDPGYKWLHDEATSLGLTVLDPRVDPGHISAPPTDAPEPKVAEPLTIAAPIRAAVPPASAASASSAIQAPIALPVEASVPQVPAAAANPFIDIAKQYPAAAAAQAANPGNPFLAGPANPLLPAPAENGSNPLQLAAEAAGRFGVPFEARHPYVAAARDMLVEQVNDVASFLKFGLTGEYAEKQDIWQSRTPGGADFGQPMPEVTPEEAQRMDRVVRGAALVASFVPSIAVSRTALATASIGGQVVGKAGAFLTGEFLGGSVYGALEPLPPGESRLENIVSQGAQFAAFGGALRGSSYLVSRGFKRYILAMPRARRILALRLAREGLDRVDSELRSAGTSLESLPDEARASAEAPILRQAIEETDPAAILDLDEYVQRETQRAVEPTPRFDEPNRLGAIEAPPGERALDLPDEEFQQALQKTEPFRAPAATESPTVVSGLEPTAEAIARNAIEPQQVHLPVPPPKGFEPTATGAEAQGAPGTVERLALADAAVDEAVQRIEPLQLAAPEVRSDAALVEQLAQAPIEAGRGSQRVADALNKALEKEPTAAEAQVVLDLTQPAPYEVPMERQVSKGEARQVRKGLEKALEREKAPIELSPHEQVGRDYEPGQIAPPLNGLEIAVHLKDPELEALMKKVSELGEKGAVPAGVLGRIATFGVGSTMEWVANSDNTDPAVATGLHTFGRLLMAVAAAPLIAKLAKDTGWIRALIEQFNPTWLMSTKGAEVFRQARGNLNKAGVFAHGIAENINKLFTDAGSKRNLMYVLDEGVSAPEWHMLSAPQQQMAVALHQMSLRLGQILKASGVIDEYIENYVRHLLPPEAFQRWRVNGYRVLPTSLGKRHILGLRDLEAWAQQQGVPGPIMDPAYVHQYHLTEAYRTLGNARLRTALEGLGIIQDAPKSPFAVVPPGTRQIRISGMGNKVAPSEVASALESMATPGATVEWLNGLDTVKSWWMRGVMFWWWEHGANVLRSRLAMWGNPVGWSEAAAALKRSDPIIHEMAGFGVNLYDRPDYGTKAALAAQQLMQKSGVTGMTARAIGGLTRWNDKILWDNLVPTLQAFTWMNEMAKWTDRTKGQFLPHTPEYIAAGRKAADYANTIAGRIPQDLVNPKLAQGMRLLLFSPQWTMSRIALTAHAAGELSNALGATSFAELSNAMKNGVYLPFKIRQLAAGIGITYALSKALSGKDPEFNPQTHKFYARTGWFNAKGREMGLDVLGWWQGDLQLFSDFLGYVGNRLNPALQIAQQTITGRDFAGRSMTGMEKIGNIFQSFGPIPEAAMLATREIQGATGTGPPVTAGERLSRISGTLATGNVASLPRPIDVAIARVSKKLLQGQGIPANDDLVFELSRILRSNVLSGRDMIDNGVINYLAYRRRSHQIDSPISGGVDYLWQSARRVVSDF